MKEKTTKRIAQLLVVFMIVTNPGVVAYAVTADTPTEDVVIDCRDEYSTRVLPQQLTPPSITDEPQIPHEELDPNCVQIIDKPSDPIRTTKASTRAVYGIYYSLDNMSDSKMGIIVRVLNKREKLSAVEYNNVYCYRFSEGENTIYMACSAFVRSCDPRASTSVSKEITDILNSGANSFAYTTIMYSNYFSWNGMDCYHWRFARIGVQAFYAKNETTVILNTTVLEAYDFVAYDYSIQDYDACTLKVAPEMTVQITNTGTQAIRYDSYKLSGKGERTPTTIDLSKYVKMGYKLQSVIGDIAENGLTLGTIKAVLGLLIDFPGTSSNDRTLYNSSTKPLGSSGKYCYYLSTQTPFSMRLPQDYVEMEVGITGTKTATTKQAITLNWIVS